MLTARHIPRPALVIGIICALLAFALSGVADARAVTDDRAASGTSSLAGTTAPRQDMRSPDARDAARADEIAAAVKRFEAANATERYYSSYGDAEPLVQRQSPGPSNDIPWLPIALSVAAALALVAVATTQVLRRRHAATA